MIAGAQGTDKERLLAKELVEGHRDELTPHQKEKNSEIVQVWDYTVNESLKRFDRYYLYQQDASFFR